MKYKSHVKNIKRVGGAVTSRLDKIRLDKNERISPFDKKFIKKFKNSINSSLLTAYPEFGIQ